MIERIFTWLVLRDLCPCRFGMHGAKLCDRIDRRVYGG